MTKVVNSFVLSLSLSLLIFQVVPPVGCEGGALLQSNATYINIFKKTAVVELAEGDFVAVMTLKCWRHLQQH